MAQHPPAARPVDPRGFHEFGRHVLERGQIDDDAESDAAPQPAAAATIRDRFHVRQRAQAVGDLLELPRRTFAGMIDQVRTPPDDGDMLGVEGARAHEVREAAGQENGGGEENDGQCHLAADERDARARACGTDSSGLEHRRGADAGRCERG